MENEIKTLLLNGMPFSNFIVFYLVGIAGAVMFYLANVYESIMLDDKTPSKWSWKHFFKGTIRIVLSLITLAVVIIWFKDLSPFLFNASGIEVETVDINALSSFIAGIGIDGAWKKILGIKKVGQKIVKNKKS
jgi:hypothetical protein